MPSLRFPALILCLALAGATFAAEPEGLSTLERQSSFLRMTDWRGSFVDVLIKAIPPRGKAWRQLGAPGGTWQLMAPAGLPVDAKQSASRLVRIALTKEKTSPRPVVSLHVFPQGDGEPSVLTSKLAKEYATRYLALAVKGVKLTPGDQAYVARGRDRFVMVTGTYDKDGTRLRVAHFAFYEPRRQFFLTLHCADEQWPQYQETLAQIFMSFHPYGPRKG